MSKDIITLESKAQQLDEAAAKYRAGLNTKKSPFTAALALAQGIKALRGLLTDDIMNEIMALADTPLGFMTDKKDKGGYAPKEIKDAIIEASLRGFRVAGNEFNIIASRFYGAKSGLHRKVIHFPGLTDFKETFSVPKFSQSRDGAIVTAKATWILNDKDGRAIRQELFPGEREFAIRSNAGSGVDGIIGKCQRKLYASGLNQLQGIVTPDGEIDDSISTEATVVTESKEKAQGPEPTEGTWEGKLTKVERKPYATGKEEEGWYFILTIDNGWRASTLSESIHEQAEIAVGLDVRMEVKAGKSRGNFNIESFEVLKPQQEKTATEQDDLPME